VDEGAKSEDAKVRSSALGVNEHYARHSLRVFVLRAFPSGFRAFVIQTS
jgi:hypothetical protein